MIYRQTIPLAPAYLGLNLLLKGAQICPKNVNGKKDKHRSNAVKSKYEQRVSQLQSESQKMFPSLISPRVLSMNVPFRTGSSKKSLVSARLRTGIISQQFVKSKALKKHNISYSSRRGSCGIKTSPNNPDMKDGELHSMDNKDLPNIETHKMKCVGSRCVTATGVPMINNKDKANYVMKRKKQQTKPPRTEPKLNALGNNSRPIESKVDEIIDECRKDWTKNTLKVTNESLTKPSPSHFYAIGHTLRTWQTKFSNIKTKPTV